MITKRESQRQLWAILSIAAVVRLVGLAAHPLLFDEAFVAIGARDIAWNGTAMWDAISNAPFVALLSLVIRLLGDSVFVLRLLPALAGIGSVYALYMLQRRFFSKPVALLGALIFAIHPFAVAFSRVLFADPLQLFFVIIGWLAIDRFILETDHRHRRWLLIEIAFVWALAFLMKYNAILPGGLWILAGWLGGRYSFKTSIVASIAVLTGPALTLLIWPYDAPFWFFAYLRQGGNYDLANAATYYVVKLRLIFFGLTPLITASALVIRFRAPSDRTRATALFAIYSLAYLFAVILLGRTFERYLLVVTPALSMVAAGLTSWLWDAYRAARSKIDRSMLSASLIVFAGALSIGMTIEYIRYAEYLSNAIDLKAVTDKALTLRTGDERIYWYIAEPNVGYYLGFTRDYSRALATDTTASGRYSYFEGSAMPHSDDRSSYHVLDIRRYARRVGLRNILSDPATFLDSVKSKAQRPVDRVPAIDYITASRPGDLLVVQTGMQSVQGEPILQKLDTNSLPPTLDRLPLDRFNVQAVFRPEGPGPITDTTLTRLRAGIWILRKR